jgi:hypothetical protein
MVAQKCYQGDRQQAEATMDRRARKIEQKRKQRELVKKEARSALARRPGLDATLVKVAAGAPFGACYLSEGWDDASEPALVTALVSRALPGGRLVAGVALVDRTCLGVKNGYVPEPMRSSEFDRFVGATGLPHGGMVLCEPLAVQSVVFHAIDYANKLGFKPHRDFPAALFGPRPEVLTHTPWSTPDKPIFIAGPADDAGAIIQQLTATVGEGKFDYVMAAQLA